VRLEFTIKFAGGVLAPYHPSTIKLVVPLRYPPCGLVEVGWKQISLIINICELITH